MKNAFIIGFVNFWILGFTFLFGQSPFKNVQIPPVNSKYAFNECEPSIAINPRNTNEIAAGSVLKGYHYSIDGGHTWTSKKCQVHTVFTVIQFYNLTNWDACTTFIYRIIRKEHIWIVSFAKRPTQL